MNDMLYYEEEFKKLGYKLIAGVDESGRGPIAGPVVACAVILKADANIEGIDDSKKLSKKRRQELLSKIKTEALSIGISFVSPKDIDQINILRASRLAMAEAIKALKVKPDFILTDFMDLSSFLTIPFESLVKGDQKSASIAAASIIAKETRDDYMIMIDKHYPQYGFKNHMGYPTKAHIEAIKKFGITPIHRKTFKPIKNILAKNKD